MSPWPHTCSMCGAQYSRDQWAQLELLGIHLGCLEARQCSTPDCHNTLAIETEDYRCLELAG